MAGSGLRPLSNLSHCWLPQESGPCLSPSVADHPLRPATDRRLGEPLPHQLANQTRADLSAMNLSPTRISPHRTYPVLAQVSLGYPEPKGTFPRVTHPSATHPEGCVRLACVKPAASVRSEPGSNSQVQRVQSRHHYRIDRASPQPNRFQSNRDELSKHSHVDHLSNCPKAA